MKLMQLLETINYPSETPRQISSTKQYLKDYEDELANLTLNIIQDHNYLNMVEQQILGLFHLEGLID